MTRYLQRPQSDIPKGDPDSAMDLLCLNDGETNFLVSSPKNPSLNNYGIMTTIDERSTLIEEDISFNENDHRAKVCRTIRHKTPWNSWIKKKKIEMLYFLSPKNLQMILVGGTIYALYNLVFCLAMASSITTAHRTRTMLGPIAKLCTMGVVAGAPLLLLGLSTDHPALYPVFDLFLAPFMADIAAIVDTTMYEQSQRSGENAVSQEKYEDVAFLTTYTLLIGIGLSLTTLLNLLGSRVKLANIGEYLPYPVLCGFFSTVGVTLWTLAIAVDAGKTVQQIMSSKSWDLVKSSFIHHLPSALIGSIMYTFGSRNRLLVTFMALTIILLSHAVLFLSNISLEQAQSNNWFWTAEKLKVEISGDYDAFEPFGVVYGVLFTSHVNYEAVVNAFPTTVAMSLVYTLRCYLFASAFRKSAVEASDIIAQKEVHASSGPSESFVSKRTQNPTNTLHRRASSITSQNGVQEEIYLFQQNDDIRNAPDQATKTTAPQVSKTLSWCGADLILISLVGTGGPILPGIGISPSLLKIGVEGLAPQLTSIALLAYFYATDMSIICYIPKMTFSCLLVLSAMHMINTWFLTSFSKMKQKVEWLAVPLIIAFYFMFDMLKAVALGVALSTFIFVASFYRTGVIKFMATGRTIQSSVARTFNDADLLYRNGDMIQILVLQNYLFFGNASCCLTYIEKMFEEIPENERREVHDGLPPIPKYLIIDLSLVTGIDASTADVLSEALSICKSNDCSFFVVGMSSAIKSALICGGFKPKSLDRSFRFISNLEAALGRAEDALLSEVFRTEEEERRKSVERRHIRLASHGSDSGFRYALQQIDQQHGIMFTSDLLGLEKYCTPVEIEVGESLYQRNGGVVSDDNRGLFFIETGLLRVEREARVSNVSRQANRQSSTNVNVNSKNVLTGKKNLTRKFRLARVGPGYVVGGIELSTGVNDPGIPLAVTKCRLHHLPYRKLSDIEKAEPFLMLNLYKLLSFLIARREEKAVEQLVTMHSIVGSVPDFKPKSRSVIASERTSSQNKY